MNNTVRQYNSILNTQQSEIKSLKSKVEGLENTVELLQSHGITSSKKEYQKQSENTFKSGLNLVPAPQEEDDDDELGSYLRNLNKN